MTARTADGRWWADRFIWLVAVAAVGLTLWALRDVLGDLTGRYFGDRVDSAYAVWALWWDAQPGAEGEVSRWISYPYGERGSILVPLASWLTRPAQWLLGPMYAFNTLVLGYILADCAAVGVLAATWTGSRRAGAVAALALLAGRPVIAQFALGNPEGGALAPLALALAAGIRWGHGRPDRGWGLLLGALFAASVVENPYTIAPGLIAAAVFAVRRLRGRPGGVREVGLALLAGCAGVGLRLMQLGGEIAGHTPPVDVLDFMDAALPRFDLHPFEPLHLLWGGAAPQFSADTEGLMASGALQPLGVGVLLLSLCAGLRRGWIWVLAAALCVATAAGSAPLGSPGPPGLFLLMNLALDLVLAPLTQPFRFLALAAVPLAVLAGAGAHRLAGRLGAGAWYGAAVVLIAEAALLGGPAIGAGAGDLRPWSCMTALTEGAVHTARAPGSADTHYQARPMMLQLLHERPGTHRGLGGEWVRAERDPNFDADLEMIDRCLDGRSTDVRCPAALHGFVKHGVTWVVAPEASAADMPSPHLSCGGWSGWRVADLEAHWRATGQRHRAAPEPR